MIYFVFAVYAIIAITFVLLYFFVIYHLSRYSINAHVRKIILPIFIVFSTLLLFSNILLFFAVDWNYLLSQIF